MLHAGLSVTKGLFAVVGLVALASSLASVAAQDIVRIEEHWELAITQADSQTNAPQVMMQFSPFGAESDWHFELDLNHASVPEYSAGGFQVRAMQGDSLVADARLLPNARLDAQSELLTWVQIAQKQPSGWAFAVGFGSSVSWGSFGGPETVVTLPTGELPIRYSPQNSLAASGVIYAKNRVERLTLRKVRYYFSNNQYIDVNVGSSVE